MPYVTVFFDPQRVQQSEIDKLKQAMPAILAKALNNQMPRGDQWNTPVESILVRQQAFHPTDVNISPVEIDIQAGRRSNRSETSVTYSINQELWRQNAMPKELIEEKKCGLWLRFNDQNDFRILSTDLE